MADFNKTSLPTHANVYVWRGDYVEFSVNFTDDDQDAYDLTGYRGMADIVQNSNVVGSFDVDIDEAAGKATLSLESDASASLVPGLYNYDFQLVQDSSDRVKTFIYGTLIVKGEITIGI